MISHDVPVPFITASIRRMGEGNVFSLFTSGGGQYSRGGWVSPAGGGGGQSSQGGVGQSSRGGGVSSASGGGWVSGSVQPGGVGGVSQDRTYYTAGSMPLAFTQEDFLVLKVKNDRFSTRRCSKGYKRALQQIKVPFLE